MADAASRNAPIPSAPAVFPNVTVAPAAPLARFSLRAREPGSLADVIGRPLPDRIGGSADGIARLGPDEWLARLPAGTSLPSGEGLPLAIVDVSERAIGFVIEGKCAIALLSCGCPRDIARFTDGYVTRTIYEGVEIVLWRENATRFQIDVWRSFAPWLWAALTKAAPHV